ncbi:MAG: hypothetical protein GQ532_12970 [Methylomarinum sp.]|nr:hypothetical protein [Methylomarinum sp.]
MNQKISRFLDDELAPAELESILLEIDRQPEFKKTMQRYQLMSQVLRSDDVVLANNDFLHKVTQDIKQEPHHFLPKQAIKQKLPPTWQKAFIAIAASVAIVAVIVFHQGGPQKTESPQLMAQTSDVTLQTQAVNNSQHQRLKAYLKAHSDDIYVDGAANFQSYARVASYGRD